MLWRPMLPTRVPGEASLGENLVHGGVPALFEKYHSQKGMMADYPEFFAGTALCESRKSFQQMITTPRTMLEVSPVVVVEVSVVVLVSQDVIEGEIPEFSTASDHNVWFGRKKVTTLQNPFLYSLCSQNPVSWVSQRTGRKHPMNSTA